MRALCSLVRLTGTQKLKAAASLAPRRKEREQALEELGITVEKGGVGVHTPKKFPFLVNLNEDELMSECLVRLTGRHRILGQPWLTFTPRPHPPQVYQLKPGNTTVGNADLPGSSSIKLSGTRILAQHCTFVNENGIVTVDAAADSLTVRPPLPHRAHLVLPGLTVPLCPSSRSSTASASSPATRSGSSLASASSSATTTFSGSTTRRACASSATSLNRLCRRATA